MGSAPPEAGIGAFKAYAEWFNHEAADALADIEIPIYLITSDYRPTNLEAGWVLTDSFDAALMSGVGHFVMQEDPQQFNRLLDRLISLGNNNADARPTQLSLSEAEVKE